MEKLWYSHGHGSAPYRATGLPFRDGKEHPLKGPKIFYGWVIVLIAATGGVFTLGTGLWSMGAFVIPMEEELGWNRTTLFAGMTIRALAAGAMAPFIGPIFDTRKGPRILTICSAVILGVSLIGIRWVDEVWQYYVLFGGVGALANVTSGIVLIEAVVPKWFIRQRGRAVAAASMGGVLGPIFPLAIQWAISAYGWRDAWVAMGLVSIVILLPLGFLVRTQPEDMGLRPDGDSPGDVRPSNRGGRAVVPAVDLSRGQALRTGSFWILILTFSITSLGVQGFISNWLPYFQDIGFTATTGAFALTVFGIFVLPARFGWGYLADIFSVRHLLLVQHILTALVVLLLLNIGNYAMLMTFAVLMGLAYGGYVPLQRLIYPIYYGRAHLGAIRGAMRPAITLASAAGPLVIAGIYDIQGSYALAFWMVMGTWFVAGLMFLLVRPPRRQPAPNVSPTE